MEQPTNTTDTKSLKQITPEVTWAQRSSTTDAEKNHIYLTISVPDVDPKKIELDVQPTSLTFTGYSETKKATYHVKLDFFGEIEPKESKINHSPRDVEMVLQKKELKEEYWPRLLKDKAKVHYLKTNFDKWVDEDEQNDIPEEEDYASKMGGMGAGGMGGAGGMPGMGGMGGMGGGGGDGGFGGIDFSKLGGMGGGEGGMPDMAAMQQMMAGMGGGAGMPGMGGMGGDDDDEDDEDMPELESEDNSAETGKSADTAGGATSKIEEVE